MAVPEKREVRATLGRGPLRFLATPAPAAEFPKAEVEPSAAYQLVHDEMLLDGNSRQNLATFCQTWVEPQLRQLMDECLDKNMIDRDEYPQMAEIESRCVHMLADLWNAPDRTSAAGCSTSGSSEAVMLAGLAMKWRWRKKRLRNGQATGKPNLICGLAHVCWPKFARYFDVELRQIPCEGNRFIMSPAEVVKRCDENTIGVVPTLGTPFTLQYEPVESIAMALDDLQEEHGVDIPIHVDAASGGFIAPFVDPDFVWDFRIPRVKSINASGHKFGLAPLGCGWVVWRESRDLPHELIFRVKVLGGNMPTLGLNFSRPGGQVVCQYYNFIRLGREGYARIMRSCGEVGRWISDQIAGLGPFEILNDSRLGIPGCCWKMKYPAKAGFSLYDLADRLRVRGWQVPTYPMPANRQDLVVQRVVARLGVSRDLAGELIEDIRKALRHLEEYPPRKSLTYGEGGGYHHG